MFSWFNKLFKYFSAKRAAEKARIARLKELRRQCAEDRLGDIDVSQKRIDAGREDRLRDRSSRRLNGRDSGRTSILSPAELIALNAIPESRDYTRDNYSSDFDSSSRGSCSSDSSSSSSGGGCD